MFNSVPSAWKSVPLNANELDEVVRGMQAYYDERAEQYDDWYQHVNLYDDPTHNDAWHAELAQMTEWVTSFGHGQLLEVASGTGWWTRQLARRTQVTTLDYAPSMIAMLRRRLHEEQVSVTITRGDAYHLPFVADSFDGCFFGFWLSHVPVELLAQFFGEVNRVVRASGQVMLIDSKPFRGEMPGVPLKQERILNDGSRHQIIKVYHNPKTLRRTLEPFGAAVRTWSSARFFTAGRYTVQ